MTNPMTPTETPPSAPPASAKLRPHRGGPRCLRQSGRAVRRRRPRPCRPWRGSPPARQDRRRAPNEERQAQLADWYARSADCSSRVAAIWAERATTHVVGEHDLYLEGLPRGRS